MSDPILVLGATGATGRLLTADLLQRGCRVKAVVRSADRLPGSIRNHERLEIVESAVLDLSSGGLEELVKDCSAVASCLGHTLSFKGIFGKPRRLVTDATRRICEAVAACGDREKPVRFVLMNTTGNRNRDLEEKISFAQKCVIALLRICIPPHADNEDASDYLRTQIGQDHPQIEWAAVRPDGLTNEDKVTPFDLHPSPTRSAIFNAGKTSRINVARFMADLLTNSKIWKTWKGKMPVIYNR